MDGFLLIVGIYVVITVVGAIQKKQRLERERAAREAASLRPGALPSGPAAPVEQLTGLERALEALRRAELEAKARAEAQRRLPQMDGRTPVRFPLAQQQGGLLSAPRQAASAEFDYEAEATEDAEDSEEEIFSVEAINLDEESAREAAGRQGAVARYRAEPRAAEVVSVSSPVHSRIQTAVVSNIPAAEAEPSEFTTPRAARSTPLARFASGRVRDAIVLNEILARPVGERM